MLNISNTKINIRRIWRFSAIKRVERYEVGNVLSRLILFFLIVFILAMFLPWTQTVQSRGKVTTFRPEQRPQNIQSGISGRIEAWYVQEGDFVKEGDTIIRISEIKSEYLDPQIIERAKGQVDSKKQAIESYRDKVINLENQISALETTKRLKLSQIQNKLEQARLKIESDSMEYQAAKVDYDIAMAQYERLVRLYEQGLKSLTSVEKRKQTLQKARANVIAKENKLLISRNVFDNLLVELNSIRAQYEGKIAKAESEKNATLSRLYDAEGAVQKLTNQLANYTLRSNMHYITAPQDGFVTKVYRSGVGELIKEGTVVVTIMPASYQLAVEMYVRPIDLPLLEKGQHVRIQFDGWPAIVFSGWPNTGYGTFGGEIYAIDNFTSPNGLYRIMVKPDPHEHPWPEALRIGAGTHNMVLLKVVPVWYEIWRQLNGFPPDYYKPEVKDDSK